MRNLFKLILSISVLVRNKVTRFGGSQLQNSQGDGNTCMNLSNNKHSFHAIGFLEIRSGTSGLFQQQLIVDSSPRENQ